MEKSLSHNNSPIRSPDAPTAFEKSRLSVHTLNDQVPPNNPSSGNAKCEQVPPITEYLLVQTSPKLELILIEIEQIIGNHLSACAPHWWISGENSRRRPLWQEAWRSAGFDAALVRGAGLEEFRRCRSGCVADRVAICLNRI